MKYKIKTTTNFVRSVSRLTRRNMTVKIKLKKCSDELLHTIFDAVALDGKAELKVRYLDEEKLRPEVSAQIAEDMAELEEQKKNGTARLYKSVKEFREDVLEA